MRRRCLREPKYRYKRLQNARRMVGALAGRRGWSARSGHSNPALSRFGQWRIEQVSPCGIHENRSHGSRAGCSRRLADGVAPLGHRHAARDDLRGGMPLRVVSLAAGYEGSLGYHADDPNGMVQMDGSFVLDGLLGERCLKLLNVGSSWSLQSITADGRDVTNVPLVFESGQEIGDVVFRVTPDDPIPPAPIPPAPQACRGGDRSGARLMASRVCRFFGATVSRATGCTQRVRGNRPWHRLSQPSPSPSP
jgi:hypothetical protein